MTRPSTLIIVLAVLATAGGAWSAAEPWRRVGSVPGFSGWREELQRLADRDGHARRNTFCIVVDDSDPGDATAVVYWKEGRRLSAYGRSDEPMGPLTHSGAPLDLRHDLVDREDQIAGSTYRETRTWAASRIAACRRFGTTLTLLKARRP